MRFFLRPFIAAALLLALTIGQPALAVDGVMSAMRYLPMPEGAAVSVQILDNSTSNLALKQQLEQAIRDRGMKVAEDGRLILTIETKNSSGAWTGTDTHRLIELQNQEDHSGADAPNVRLKLFDSSRGGLLNKQADKGVNQVAASEFRLEITMDDRENGRRLWQGWATAPIGASDDNSLPRAMIPVLVEGLGQTVRSRVIPIQ